MRRREATPVEVTRFGQQSERFDSEHVIEPTVPISRFFPHQAHPGVAHSPRAFRRTPNAVRSIVRFQ